MSLKERHVRSATPTNRQKWSDRVPVGDPLNSRLRPVYLPLGKFWFDAARRFVERCPPVKREPPANTRHEILAVAEKCFAASGFGGTSINQIAAATRYSKPVIYYYFKSKVGLFNALLDYAYDECFERMKAAVTGAATLELRLTEVLASQFNFLREHQGLTRLAFASAFATTGEMPFVAKIRQKRRRNLEFVHDIVKQGQKNGVLNGRLNSRELAYGIYGALSFRIMANLLLPGTRLDRAAARNIVALFMDGAREGGGNRTAKSKTSKTNNQ